ncbi:MAG: hypothetical protein LQ345_006380, partial [Seirophora villosa]
MSIQPEPVPRPPGKKPFRLASIRDSQPRSLTQEAPPPKKRKIDRIQVCTVPTCQSRNLEEDNGYLVCQTCGVILQEANIVSDNMFIDGPGGEAVRAGVTVANDSARPRNYDAMAARIVGGMTSREVSEANGRQAIRAVSGHPLNVVQDLQDTAMQVYKLCLANNFVQGRLTRSVAAVCLYIACRRSKENNKFMLIDFADKCNINVFKLGTIFKDLLEVLHINSSAFQSLEPINVESLILRFAEQMNFGRMKQRIANEAVRIVQRMSRDWMTDGRRPAGICGAALILAARMNNFRRVVREVVYTVKVAEQTILNRLHEFSQTASSGLTVDEFRTQDLEQAEDPPAFKNRNKVKKKRGRPKKKRSTNDNDTDATPTESSPERSASVTPSNANDQLQIPANTQAERDRRSMPPPPVPIDPALLHVSSQRLAELQSPPSSSSTASTPLTRSRGRPPGKTNPPPEPTNQDLQIEAQLEADIQNILNNETNIENARNVHENPDVPGITSTSHDAAEPLTPPATQPDATSTTRPRPDDNLPGQSKSPAQAASSSPSQTRPSSTNRSPSPSSSLTSPPSSSPSSSRTSSPHPNTPSIKPTQLITSTSTTQPLLDLIPSSEIIPAAEFDSDPEIAACLLTAPEIAIKERIWVHENSAYLRAQQAKLLKRELAERNGTARVVVKRKRKRTRMGDLSGIYGNGNGVDGEEGAGGEQDRPRDAAEAVERMMRKRGFSRKINYGVIGSAYGASSSASSASSPSGSAAATSSRRASVSTSTATTPPPPPPPPTTSNAMLSTEQHKHQQATAGAKETPPAAAGASRNEAIEILGNDDGEGEDSDDDDPDDYYYDEEDEMAG